MFTVILLALACYGISVAYLLSDNEGLPFSMGLSLLHALTGAMIGIATALILGAIFPLPEYVDKTYSQPVVAAALGDKIEGGFLVFREANYYSYFTKAEDGAISLRQVPVRDAVIYEDVETDAYIKVYDWKTRESNWKFTPDSADDKYEFHVPAGSVTQSISFDLEGN